MRDSTRFISSAACLIIGRNNALKISKTRNSEQEKQVEDTTGDPEAISSGQPEQIPQNPCNPEVIEDYGSQMLAPRRKRIQRQGAH